MKRLITNAARPTIVFKDVTVEYGKYITALKNVSFTIKEGEFVFIVGRTGSGKSTILKLLDGQVKPTSGSVIFDGQNIGELRDRDIPFLRRRLGIVPQDFGLLPRKRAWENIGYAMRAVGSTRKEVRKTVGAILEQVNIGHRADAFPSEMSGGEQQRLAIARALINSPHLILADEPTGNLDAQHSFEIIQLLDKLNSEGATVLVATHDLMVIEQFNKRVITMAGGEIVGDEGPHA